MNPRTWTEMTFGYFLMRFAYFRSRARHDKMPSSDFGYTSLEVSTAEIHTPLPDGRLNVV